MWILDGIIFLSALGCIAFLICELTGVFDSSAERNWNAMVAGKILAEQDQLEAAANPRLGKSILFEEEFEEPKSLDEGPDYIDEMLFKARKEKGEIPEWCEDVYDVEMFKRLKNGQIDAAALHQYWLRKMK